MASGLSFSTSGDVQPGVGQPHRDEPGLGVRRVLGEFGAQAPRGLGVFGQEQQVPAPAGPEQFGARRPVLDASENFLHGGRVGPEVQLLV